MNKLLKKYQEVVDKRWNQPMLIEASGEYITYATFDDKVNSLLAYLSKQFKKSQIISVLSRDNLDYLYAMIACWKLDKIYMPINYSTPAKKISDIMRECEIDRILSRDYYNEIPNIEKVEFDFSATLDRPFKYKENTNEIAYILSTSGTSGNPKMVQVSFSNLYWLLDAMHKLIPFNADDCFIISTPPQFDVSFHENLAFMFGTGVLRFLEPGTAIQQFKRLKDVLFSENITHIALSPTSLKTILAMSKDKIAQAHLKNIILAGEVLPFNLVKEIEKVLPETKIWNFYGPTETTVYASFYCINKHLEGPSVPIGQALPGVDIKIYNQEAGKQQTGLISKLVNEDQYEIGEILIGGQGVSRGYYKNKELTTEKFVLMDGQIYYKTGDLGMQKDGLLYFQGRKDRQIKINGIRIELDEIEQAIQENLPNYINFHVLKINKSLVLFSVEKIDFPVLRAKLIQQLPAYMIPSHYLQVSEIRLTASNKLDTAFLEAEFVKRYDNCTSNNGVTIKAENLKDTLVEILKDTNFDDTTNLLLLPQVDSLLQIEMIVALENLYGLSLPDDFINKYQTIAEMKRFFATRESNKYTNEIVQTQEINFTDLQKEYYYANLSNINMLNDCLLKKR